MHLALFAMDSGDLLQRDMGQGMPFRAGVFDGVISISALQWLCYVDKAEQSARPRLMRFFSSLYTVLKRDARAALQFYPQCAEQVCLNFIPSSPSIEAYEVSLGSIY